MTPTSPSSLLAPPQPSCSGHEPELRVEPSSSASAALASDLLTEPPSAWSAPAALASDLLTEPPSAWSASAALASDLLTEPPSAWSASAALASDLLTEAEETVEEWYVEADAEISRRLDDATRHMAAAARHALEAMSLVDEIQGLLADAAVDRDHAARELEDAVESAERIHAQARAERDRLIATAGEEAANLRAEGRRALGLALEAAHAAATPTSTSRRTIWQRLMRRASLA